RSKDLRSRHEDDRCAKRGLMPDDKFPGVLLHGDPGFVERCRSRGNVADDETQGCQPWARTWRLDAVSEAKGGLIQDIDGAAWGLERESARRCPQFPHIRKARQEHLVI